MRLAVDRPVQPACGDGGACRPAAWEWASGSGSGVGLGVGLGVGVGVGLGSGDVTVLAARSLISAGPSGVPRPVCVFAVAPVRALPGVVPPPQPGSQPPNPPHQGVPEPGLLLHGVPMGLAAIAWKSVEANW